MLYHPVDSGVNDIFWGVSKSESSDFSKLSDLVLYI